LAAGRAILQTYRINSQVAFSLSNMVVMCKIIISLYPSADWERKSRRKPATACQMVHSAGIDCSTLTKKT